ncbi:RHS repeat-associated core domain-containing protein [Lentisphaerota bacterium WC36G]|nr:RHS repeat-associated core domain-containing protein [Lentisphaerae bacterium WC36]
MALEKDGVVFNYIADGNKNITQLIDMSSGSIANRYDYSPFGQLIADVETVENPFKFSSEFHDEESGLVYYNYRYYNPTTGKWLNRDPIQEKGGLNIYGFVNNQPITKVDNLGHDAKSVKHVYNKYIKYEGRIEYSCEEGKEYIKLVDFPGWDVLIQYTISYNDFGTYYRPSIKQYGYTMDDYTCNGFCYKRKVLILEYVGIWEANVMGIYTKIDLFKNFVSVDCPCRKIKK